MPRKSKKNKNSNELVNVISDVDISKGNSRISKKKTGLYLKTGKRGRPAKLKKLSISDDDISVDEVKIVTQYDKERVLKEDGFKPLTEYASNEDSFPRDNEYKKPYIIIRSLLSDGYPGLCMGKIPTSIKNVYVKIVDRDKDKDFGEIYLRGLNSPEYRITYIRLSSNDTALYELSVSREKDRWFGYRNRQPGVIINWYELTSLVKFIALQE